MSLPACPDPGGWSWYFSRCRLPLLWKAGFRLLSSSSSYSSKDAKAAFVTAIGALHDLHAFAKEEVLGRRSRIPMSCAGCLVIIRSLFARVDEVTSEE